MITFDKDSVILTNAGQMCLVLGIEKSFLPSDMARLYCYNDFDNYFLQNLKVTVIVLLKNAFYGDEDDYMYALTDKYLSLALPSLVQSNNVQILYKTELKSNALLSSKPYADKKIDSTPFRRNMEKYYSIQEIYKSYKEKTKNFFIEKQRAVENWNKVAPENPVAKELRNSHLYFTLGKKQYTFYLYDKPSNTLCLIDRVDRGCLKSCDIFLSTQINRRGKDWIDISDTLRKRLQETNIDMSFLEKYAQI